MSLLAFAMLEYDRRGWTMPDVHVRIFEWLERTEGARSRVLMVFRGCGKSTILGIRNAHKYRANPLHQLLVQGADDDLADDISRDTISILRGNPHIPPGLLVEPAGIRHWFTADGYAANARTPQYRGRGILSRVTGNRADEIINDDTEMSKNVDDETARAKLRKRLAEQSFILKPGGSVLWVGTPHTHDSLYEQKIKAGAEALVIPLFARQTRHNATTTPRSMLTFSGKPGPDGVWVFEGIGEHARLLTEGDDYTVTGNRVHLREPSAAFFDVCIGNAWPERFTRAEMLERRKECPSVGYWDQQYDLKARPAQEVRLNPDHIPLYAVEPTFTTANKVPQCWLGKARIVGASLRWDPSSGKLNSDTSALALMLQDEAGRRYWHRAVALKGEVCTYDAAGAIDGGQVWQICDLVEKFGVRRVVIETNGIGNFAATNLRGALKVRGLQCAVEEVTATANKNKRIVEAFEPLMMSHMLWAHVSVADGQAFTEMKEWVPTTQKQADDYLDAGAGAITDAPERLAGPMQGSVDQDSRPRIDSGGGTYEVELEL